MKIKGNKQEVRMADQILAVVERVCSGEAKLADYENGREEGYVLTDEKSGASVTFIENRNSDLVMGDAVAEFRAQRQCFESDVVRHADKAKEREFALAAKRSPQAVNATALAKAWRKLHQWKRKHKLAETKLKHYTRLVKRLNDRANKLDGSGVVS